MAAGSGGQRPARDAAMRPPVEPSQAGPFAGARVTLVDEAAEPPVAQASDQPGPCARRTRTALPDPGQAATLDDLVERLRLLKAWAGNPSYEGIKDQVNMAWIAAGRPAGELAGKTTVVDCFRLGRRRVSTDLVVAIVQALHPDVGYVAQWRQALEVVSAESTAAAQVRVQDTLPPDLAGFTGRETELDRLREFLGAGRGDGEAVVISAIEGMAGVGKTQLAIRAAHLFLRERAVDRVLFVNLRGFHPDPGQPPVDPAAVLDGFLRLLGVPGQRIPHDLKGRVALYRGLLSGARALVVLDNAADADQVRPLLPESPGCRVLVTSRRYLSDLHAATHLTVDVFGPGEAVRFLTSAAPRVPVGDDPRAAERVAARCGYLPLALGLVAGHIRAKSGWTLTDHADWLEERHRHRRLDTGVELALDLSYQHLSADRRRVLRLLALHPGHDLDAYAAAALSGMDLHTARTHLDHLCGDHLLQPGTAGRYTFHDLVRAYAGSRALDEDRPPERRAALTRLFDHYVAAAAAVMDVLHPAEAHRRPRVPASRTPAPDLTDPDTAREWLETERATLVAIAAYAAAQGWPGHTIRLSNTLFRYFSGGRHNDGVTVHGYAYQAARQGDNPAEQAHALINLASARMWLGQAESAAEHFEQALVLFQQVGDRVGQIRALNHLGIAERRLGRPRPAAEHYTGALTLSRLTGDLPGQARALNNLATVEELLGRHRAAAAHYAESLVLARQLGDRTGQAHVLANLGEIDAWSGRYESAVHYLGEALALFRQLGSLVGEADVLDSLGVLHTRVGRPAQAAGHHHEALAIRRETGHRNGEALSLNGLGEAAQAAGRIADALTHHDAAHRIAVDIGDREQQARAGTGLGHAHHALGDPALAREHYRQALAVYDELGTPEAGEIRARLDALEPTGS